MARRPRLLAPAALVALALASACAGPPIPAPIEGLPVCADFGAGHAKMAGSLRHPVRLRVMDGKTQVTRIIILGLRHPDDPPQKTYIADDNAEYTVEWAQCASERAPRSVTELAHDTAKARDKVRESDTAYECGEATVYKTDKLVTKKGDRSSHVLKFVPPPDAACWTAPPAPPAAASAQPDAGAPASDAGPADTDGGAAPAGSGAPDAGPAPAGSAAPDAGAKK
jgi:hypothetical protein